ncbi:MAG: hypothetical protein WBV79_00530 [Rhodomicrobium sp.]
MHRGITVADERQSLPISDCKTRGFNLEDSQIERTDRLDRLVLVLSLALYWAFPAECGTRCKTKRPPKKDAPAQRKNVARSLISWFKRGLHRLQFRLQPLIPPPPLWAGWKSDEW